MEGRVVEGVVREDEAGGGGEVGTRVGGRGVRRGG